MRGSAVVTRAEDLAADADMGGALGGGGVASLRIDPQGKAFAQQLLEIQIPVPQSIAEQLD